MVSKQLLGCCQEDSLWGQCWGSMCRASQSLAGSLCWKAAAHRVLHCSHWLLEVAVPSSDYTTEHSAASSSWSRTGPLRKWEGVWSHY